MMHVGMINENEFYSDHYLAEIFSGDIREVLSAWQQREDDERETSRNRGEPATQYRGYRTPPNRLASIAREILLGIEETERQRQLKERLLLSRALTKNLLSAFELPCEPQVLTLDDDTTLPVLAAFNDAGGDPLLWIEMRLQLHQAGAMCSQDAVNTVLDMLDDGTAVRPYRAAVVDEAQDFGGESLQLIRALVPEGNQDDLMVVGDGHQRIYGRKAVLGQCGINIRGRGRKLRINYRTTEQIRRFATAVLEGIDVDDLDDGADPMSGYRSLIMGEPPVLKGFADASDEAQWVVTEIQQLLNNGVTANEICLVGRTQTQLRTVVEALKLAGVETYSISRDSTDRVSIPGVVPLELSLDGTEDPVEKRAREFNERALLHVAGTRAVNGLYVTWVGEPSRLIIPPESD